MWFLSPVQLRREGGRCTPGALVAMWRLYLHFAKGMVYRANSLATLNTVHMDILELYWGMLESGCLWITRKPWVGGPSVCGTHPLTSLLKLQCFSKSDTRAPRSFYLRLGQHGWCGFHLLDRHLYRIFRPFCVSRSTCLTSNIHCACMCANKCTQMRSLAFPWTPRDSKLFLNLSGEHWTHTWLPQLEGSQITIPLQFGLITLVPVS